MASRTILARVLWSLWLLALLAGRAGAVGDASTSFQVFVPPNNDRVGRDVALIVTNVSPFRTTVDLIDDGADGDTDDTVLGIVLDRGQSYVRYIKDGAVNDDAGGKWDGDYFLVESLDPVVVQMSTKSDWQWDFVPADNKTMRGQSFFIYSPSTSSSQRDVNLVAYEDNTEVYVLDITATPLNETGLTTVNVEAPVEILKTTLNAGEDLIGRRKLGIDILDPGRTYWIRASKGVTCQYGSLAGNGRDGGGFVPSENGFASGARFYFFIPRDQPDEREVRVVSFDDDNNVEFAGWSSELGRWVVISNWEIDRFGHADWVESGTNYPFYRLLCTPGKRVSVFAASWLEAKGLSGTKDIASFASSESGYGAGKEFLAYIPQPGFQGNVVFNGRKIGNNGHLFLFGHVNGTTFEVVDADTQGTLFRRTGTINKDGYANVRMSEAEFAALNRPAQGIRPYLKVTANHLITVMVTNFNDNWMTFVPSVVLPNPLLTAAATVDQAVVGEEGCVSFVADNAGAGALDSALLEIPLDPAVSYASAELSIPGMGSPLIETDPETGAQILVWEGFSIPADGRLEGTVCFTVRARRPDGSVVRNRDFISLPVLVRGLGFGVPVAQGGEAELFTAQTSLALTVDDDSQTAVSGLAATPAGNSINVSWQTTREPDLAGFRVYRSTSGDGPFTLLTAQPIPGTGDAVTGARYLHVDRPANMNTLYYYRLEVIDTLGASSFVGPVSVLAEDRTPPEPPSLAVDEIGDGRVVLRPSGGDADGDLKGYWIHRSDTSGGVFTRINSIPVQPGAVHVDTTVGNGRSYFYRARAIDTSDNLSEFGAVVEAAMPSTISTVRTLAYEDQIGPGKNDWDYNDWVIALSSEEVFAQGGVAEVGIDIEALARGARFRNEFRLRVRAVGAWTATVDIYADRNAAEPLESRSESGSGDVDIALFADTSDALPPPAGDDFTNTLNRQNPATLGRTARVRITMANPAANPSNARHHPPFDPYLKSAIGEVHQVREGFPGSTEVVAFWPESPLLGFNLDYVLVVPGSQWRWPLENQKIWDAYPEVFTRHMLSGRQSDTDWGIPDNRVASKTYNWYPLPGGARSWVESPPVSRTGSSIPVASYASPFVASPKAIAHLGSGAPADSILLAGADKRVRLVAPEGASRAGWPIDANSFRATPAVGHLSPSDPHPTLLTAEESYEVPARVMAWELTPASVLRWQNEVGASVKAPPVIADLDADGEAEVLVVTTAGLLHVVRADGLPYPGSPVSLGTPTWNDKNILLSGPPVVMDVDGDGRLEIYAAAPSGTQVAGLQSTLAPLQGWPRAVDGAIIGGVAATRTPAGEAAIATATVAGSVYVWDGLGRLLAPPAGSLGNPAHLGEPVIAPVVAFRDELAAKDYLVVATSTGTIHLLSTNGVPQAGWPVAAAGEVMASPVVGDFDGDAEPEILVAATNGRVATWKLSGDPLPELTTQLSGAIQATPAVADLDLDSRLEVYIATSLGDLIRLDGTGASPLTGSLAAPWAGIGGGDGTNAPSAGWLLVPLTSAAGGAQGWMISWSAPPAPRARNRGGRVGTA
ncbi:MAG: LruC domain-containing protein [Candidatus Sumerlaeia bacterium]|nr:LruC domain-containing protein [Candidatus Sumerlaeia bacterium]